MSTAPHSWKASTACAVANVLAIGDTGETINEDPVARLTLRVAPPHGARPFETTIEATVPRLAVPRKGDTLAVVCDPAKPEQYRIAGLGWRSALVSRRL